LDKLNVAQLVAALDSPNGPQRDWVHQTLVQRSATGAAPALAKLASTAHRPAVRMQALCTLDGLGEMTTNLVLHAMSDPDAGVRRHAVRLAEPFLNNDEIGAAVLRLAADNDPQVRLQVAYALGEMPNDVAADSLALMARQHHTDQHLLSAVWSSVNRKNIAPLARKLLSEDATGDLPATFLDPLGALITSLGDDACLADALQLLTGGKNKISDSRLELLARVLESLDANRVGRLATGHARAGDALGKADKLARRLLNGRRESQQQILAAARILAACSPNPQEAQDLMRPLLGPQNPPAVQQAAIKVLGAMDSPSAADVLLEAWPGYTPLTRSQVLDLCLARPAFLSRLVEHLANGEVASVHIDALHRQQLLTHADAQIRDRAAALAGAIDVDRQKIVAQYADRVNQSADPARGRQVFADHCAACHKLGDLGHEVGPDLAALTSRSPLALLESIFDPNRALDERYQTYTAFTDDGLAHTGILIRETANSVTLLGQQAKEETILRKDIEELKNSGASLMPLGFEKELSPDHAADLLSYLATKVVPPKQLPGNSPRVVKADGQGTLWLLAAHAAIYGDQITFESPFQNIGYWHGQSDCVAWDVQVDHPDEYEAYLHWACTADAAGGAAVVEGFASPLHVKLEDTGGFEHYRAKPIGRIRLPAGNTRIVVRPDGPLVAPYLMDLRGIYLVPQGGDHERARAGDPPTP
jgi:putative heme-binding domain-containing protein